MTSGDPGQDGANAAASGSLPSPRRRTARPADGCGGAGGEGLATAPARRGGVESRSEGSSLATAGPLVGLGRTAPS